MMELPTVEEVRLETNIRVLHDYTTGVAHLARRPFYEMRREDLAAFMAAVQALGLKSDQVVRDINDVRNVNEGGDQ